jgi:hypothetical protein
MISAQDVFPPYFTVPAPGVAIDPRAPHNRTRNLPPLRDSAFEKPRLGLAKLDAQTLQVIR